MTHSKLALIAFLIHTTAVAQTCVVGSTEPPSEYNGTIPDAWPKTGVYSAPSYIGYVDWYSYCGYILGVNGSYFSCPGNGSAGSDIYTAVSNWNSASSSNGSTVTFYGTS